MTTLAKINSSSQDNSSNNNNNNNNNSSLVTITSQNVSDYLGKIVTNYKTPNSTEEITIDGNTYTVSTTYRLYYVDFDNKYGDGAGTIYLKANLTENQYPLANLNTWEALEGNYATSKIRNFNPMLYSDEYNQPDNDAGEIKATTWLLDTTKWSGLVTTGSSTAISNKIKYIVGAPSAEMMMDSYNTYYGLTDSDIDNTYWRTATSSRTKLVCTAPSSMNGGFGYAVGPSGDYDNGVDLYFGYQSSVYSVLPDENIIGMYTGNEDELSTVSYWLSSPAEYDGDAVLCKISAGEDAGYYCDKGWIDNDGSFHPVVALDSDVQLEFAE